MNFHKMQPRESLNKAFLKVKPNRNDIENFKKNLHSLIEKINESESEEFHKNLIGDFLKNTYYGANHFINTKGRNDFVIHNGKDAKSKVGVILEAKKPTNKSEMLKVDNLNTKALQELVLYFLRERLTEKNLEIKYLIATNIYEWFIFDANIFEKEFVDNKTLVQQFTDFEEGRLSNKKTDVFYKEIAKPAIDEIADKITFTHFDIREYQQYLQPGENLNDHQLIPLFKLFSHEHLLKLPFANDSNTLDKGFYSELLHIIGLTETKEGGKKLIQRKQENERNIGSLIENAINQLDSLDKIYQLEKPEEFGETYQEQLFNLGLELAITWVNRILFLKLLEAQLIKYHKNDLTQGFLNLQKVQNYDDLNSLFFSVLARKQEERIESVKKIFSHVPYLNSSLFEPTDNEQVTICINNLRNENLQIFSSTILKDSNGKKRIGEINALEYLFEFLNAYDFSSETGEEIQEENKRLINAAVLGLIFEKINGYKDGSFFTPGFITMYMCRETIRRAVVYKFNEVKGWNCESINNLYDQIEDRKEANIIINSLKICDPAVGSGHFLVSALNEIIAIKSELKILLDREGKRLKEYDIEVVNDELIILDEDGLLFEYNPKSKESQRVQETLFHEKQTIIESCLFGVDINPNSVKICRLRLWIELLKNAYYKTSPLTPLVGGEGNIGELETLPNIDINIKCGNSLISRFSLDTDLRIALNRSKCTIESYRNAVQTYRNAENREQKRAMEKLINDIKSNLKTTLGLSDPNKTKLRQLDGEVYNLENQTLLLEESQDEKKLRDKKISQLNNEIDKLKVEIEDIESGKIYNYAFEWRFEFPEVLNNDGDFIGFDVVIGNPPYISNREMHKKNMQNQIQFFKQNYISAKSGNFDLYIPFIEKGLLILKKSYELIYILPNKFLSAEYSREILNNISKEYSFISFTDVSSHNVFDEASVYPIIIKLSNIKNNSETTLKITPQLKDNNFLSCAITQEWNYINRSLLNTLNSFDGSIFHRIESVDKINAELQYLPGINGFQFSNYGNCITEGSSSPNSKRLIVTGIIDRYTILDKKSKYKGRNYNTPHINDNEEIISRGKWDLFCTTKILVAGMAKIIEATLDDNGSLAPGVSVYSITGSLDNLKYTLGVINSRLINWYFQLRFKNKHLEGGYISINTQILKIIPIAQPEEIFKQRIGKLVDKILTAKKSDPNADTTALETEIDQLVYQLYELTAEEIKIIEG
ncbi:MAG: Eco57I restriction-modification methylase domain-containing protein [Nostocales cyanobacterium ELA583]